MSSDRVVRERNKGVRVRNERWYDSSRYRIILQFREGLTPFSIAPGHFSATRVGGMNA